MAKAAGARVIGAARGTRKLDAARSWGADAAVDYTEPDWADQVLAITEGHGVDVIFDGAAARRAGRRTCWPRRRPTAGDGASSGAFVEVDPADAAAPGVEVVGIMDIGADEDPAESRRSLERLTGQRGRRHRHPPRGTDVPLAEAAAATRGDRGSRTVGKT